MIVRLRVLGELAQYFGSNRVQVQLSAEATLRDLWEAVDARWGGVLPPHLWDAGAKRFRQTVIVVSHGAETGDDDARLSDQQEIFLLPPVFGG